MILDNAPSHPDDDLKSDDGNIFSFFLPPNATSLIQPMDQSVIETMKRLYRKPFLRQLLGDEDEIALREFWKKYNMKHVVDNVSEAWNDVSNDTLKRSWNKLWPLPAELPEPADVIDDQFLADTSAALSLESHEILEWLNIDEFEMGYQLMTDDEIIEMAQEDDEAATDSEANDYDGGEGHVENVSQRDLRQEAKHAIFNIQKFIEWYEKQQDANKTDAMILRRLRSFAQNKAESTVKQSKLTEFFKPSETS